MSQQRKTLPVEDGFSVPGEHQPHRAVWMSWPMRLVNVLGRWQAKQFGSYI